MQLVQLGCARFALGGFFSTQIGSFPGMISDALALDGVREVRRPKKMAGSSSWATKKREGKKSQEEKRKERRKRKIKREEKGER